MIYVPDDANFNGCYVVQSDGVIRAYDRVPQNNVSYNYRDYYINSSYIYRDGNGTWSQYATLPICLDNDIITHNYVYRNDFASILIIFVLMVGIVWFLISKLIKTLLRGHGRY